MYASVSQDMEARYAIINARRENGANLARWTVCVKMERRVTHSMANAYAPGVGPAHSVMKNVLRNDMDRIVVRNVVAETVEAAIIFLASVIVLLAIQDHSVMIFARLGSTVTNADQSVNVRTVVLVILQLANATVHLDGLVQCARIVVQKVSGVKIALKSVIVTMRVAVIILLDNANANPATMAKSV